ncbi:NAD(P)H-binding protein [Microbacterium radiodurans]|uniref:NAD(P)H-binding protein n=1 Tax=Microbacterium radiodurans TaxID=661398 RepID=A0A5J5IP39_9MICO|nr:NAD(P)H-binding protein [Microbacterium radiodurans]KAA9085202.1 NAD(P)H-binding protein [Microbacterium radiodurans]
MSRILLIGGHGKVALLLEPILAERGDTVTAVIRNRDHEDDVASTGATPLVADVQSFDTDQLANLVSGNDAVVWAAGAGGGDPERTWAVDRDAAIRSIDAAVAAGVKRYVMVSYFGAGMDHGVPEDDSFYAYAEAKAEADQHLRESGLDWTIVAPSALTLDEPTGAIAVGGSGKESVARADVAAVIAAVLAEPSTVGRMIEFTSGQTPIAEAVAAS